MLLRFCLTLLALLGLSGASALADGADRAPGDVALLRPAELRSVGGELATQFVIGYGANRIAGDPVWLRGYNGGLAGPVLRLRPGDTLRVDMLNRLPKTPCNRPRLGSHGHHGSSTDPECPKPLNDPHGFNTTNLHTHGLWVSPIGNSDNVLLSLYPGDEFQNEVKIPLEHPPGTHWYHAHHHGSVALQVSSGLVGMLIVEGGLDEVPEIAQAREEILVFQQVSYSAHDCIGEDEKDVRPPEQQKLDAACIETYENFGPGIWPHVKKAPPPDGSTAGADESQLRHTTINGQVQPTIFTRPGEVVRFRAVHAGVRETVTLSIWPYSSAQKTRRLMKRLDERVLGSSGRPAGPRDDLHGEETARVVPLYELAADGIAFGRVDKVSSVTLQPGYRSDLLAKFDRLGDYVILDVAAGPDTQLRPDDGPEPTKILAFVRVSGEPVVMELPSDQDVAGLAPTPTSRTVRSPAARTTSSTSRTWLTRAARPSPSTTSPTTRPCARARCLSARRRSGASSASS